MTRMTVDSFLNGDFMDAIDNEDIEEDEQVRLVHPPWCSWYPNFNLQEQSNEDSDSEGAMESDDNGSFGSIDDLDGTVHLLLQSVASISYHTPIEEGENHFHDLSKLAEKADPEFFKYLQENDPELLNFDPNADIQSENGDGDHPMKEDEQIPELTKDHLRTWQKALLEVRINKHISSC